MEATKRYVATLEKQVLVYESGFQSGGTNQPPPGIQGQVIVVSTNWNFVIVDMLPEGNLIPLTDLNVQRDSKFIGKVRVSEIMKSQRFAVAEILQDWKQKTPIATGDYVFY